MQCAAADGEDRVSLIARDEEFFAALVSADVPRLEDILAADFLIVDISSGSVFDRAELLGAISSGAVHFPAVQGFPDEASVRRVGPVGIVVGRTAMNFQNADGSSFTAGSRYTHVYALQDDMWHLWSAQGTTITSSDT